MPISRFTASPSMAERMIQRYVSEAKAGFRGMEQGGCQPAVLVFDVLVFGSACGQFSCA